MDPRSPESGSLSFSGFPRDPGILTRFFDVSHPCGHQTPPALKERLDQVCVLHLLRPNGSHDLLARTSVSAHEVEAEDDVHGDDNDASGSSLRQM